ncbi:MAG: radical SAM protein [Myxococcota bacterium]|jgi:radical SAM protein with 4Fe4S-binding SPASM domain|nr:radical SAM protein [Myxococcota bacterium]
MLSVLQQFGFHPRSVVWELTLACNLHCRHCGSRAGRARPDEMSTERAMRLCDELADLGCKKATLGGGEPTLYKNWPMIAAKLNARGIQVNMTTNGLNFDDHLAKQIKAMGLYSVCFSVDGLQETHEYVRRVPGHFERIMNAFDICRRHKLTFSVITTVFKRNMGELEELRDLLHKRGVRWWQLQLGNPTGFCAENRDLVIEPEDVLEVVPLIARLRRESLTKPPKVFAGDNVGYYGDLEVDLREQKATVPFWIGCRAGCQVIGIESNGNVKGCLSLPSALNGVDRFVEGNLNENTLAEIWNKPGAFAYNREFTRDKLGGFCHDCEYAEICRGGCSWTTFAHTNDRTDNPYCYHRQLALKTQREKAQQAASPEDSVVS